MSRDIEKDTLESQQKRRKSSNSIDFLLNPSGAEDDASSTDNSEFSFTFPPQQASPSTNTQSRITLAPLPVTNLNSTPLRASTTTASSPSPYSSSPPSSPSDSPTRSARTSPSPERTISAPQAATPNSANSSDGEVITSVKKPKVRKELFVDEKYLTMRQSDAAFQLGFAPSTFSKRFVPISHTTHAHVPITRL